MDILRSLTPHLKNTNALVWRFGNLDMWSLGFWKKIRSLATLIFVWHKWEAESRKVNTKSFQYQSNSLKLSSCYVPYRLKTLFFDLNPNGGKSQISRRQWRRTNSQIQIQAPLNAPRDEILPQGRPSPLTSILTTLDMLCHCSTLDHTCQQSRLFLASKVPNAVL